MVSSSLGILRLLDSVMELKGFGSLVFLKLLVLQWNSQPCFLVYVCSKSNTKHFRSSRMAKTCKTGNDVKIYSLQNILSGMRGGPKTCSEWQHLARGHFLKVFSKTTACPRRPLLSGHRIQLWLYVNVNYGSLK